MVITDQNAGLAALPYTVIRIRAGDPNDSSVIHTGTGFFYAIKDHSDEAVDPSLVVSNKHVLCNKTWIEFDFAYMDDQNRRVFGPPHTVRIEAGQLPIFQHLDPNVDLAAIPLNPLIEGLRAQGQKPHALLLRRDHFAPANVQAILHAARSVLMVGFPNGIMDEANNLPVVRRGTLATPYKADYLGQTNFAVDIAAFGGSSGSPVFALFEHIVPDENGKFNFVTEPQIHLIGVLHSGPVMTAKGTIVPSPVPTTFISQTSVMIHLGYCVKASRIEELFASIKSHFGRM